MKRIVIIGCSGSGKSTLATSLGQIHGIEPFDLDTIRFIDGFDSEKRPADAFMQDVDKLSSKKNWIIEGVYYRHDIEKILWNKADTVIWLDLPLWLIQFRTWKRSIRRAIKKQTKPSGLTVSWKTEFGKNGLLRVLHKIHKATQKYYPDLLKSINDDTRIVIIKNKSSLKEFLKAQSR